VAFTSYLLNEINPTSSVISKDLYSNLYKFKGYQRGNKKL